MALNRNGSLGTSEENMDVVNTRMPELEFSWEGTDDTRLVSGSGKIEFLTSFEDDGVIFIHNGENSTFTIKRREKTMPDNVMKII